MRKVMPLILGLAASIAALGARPDTRDAKQAPPTDPRSSYRIADGAYDPVLLGGAPATAHKAPGDTVFLYGGPGSLAGKFETASMAPDPQGWQGVDLTVPSTHWHIDAFNAANLDPTPGNHALWCGVAAGEPGYAVSPGYGNDWDDFVERRWTVANPQQSTQISWSFVFNHDTEPGYDFFLVQYDSAGSNIDLAVFDGSNKDTTGQFATPATFSASVIYRPGDYVGPFHDQVRLLLRLQSDVTWSDEDGYYPTDGAVQLDNLQVTGTNGVGPQSLSFEAGDLGGWAPPADFAGDFSRVFPSIQTLDPCRDNATPQMVFFDDGTPPSNDPLGRSTGGSTSAMWNYGVPGGWVVNYTGGLSYGTTPLANQVWSPEIAWDRPGTADDGVDGGAFLRFTVWAHLPLTNGIFYQWQVRSFPDPYNPTRWSPFTDRGYVYFRPLPEYLDKQVELRDLLVNSPQKVQIALGVVDWAELFAVPGNDATVAPCFDNVAFARYDAVGPAVVAPNFGLLFSDGFPVSGAIACGDEDDTDLAVRLDSGWGFGYPTAPAAVDSAYCDVAARKPGSAVDPQSIRMEFMLDTNPCFDAERAGGLAALQAGAASGASDVQSVGGNRWRGFVKGRHSFLLDRYAFDLPDGPVATQPGGVPEPALFFPGDELRYYLTAGTVNPIETALLPADTTGFGSGRGYNYRFTVRGLPSLHCGAADTDPCTQPNVLLWSEVLGFSGDEWAAALGQNGLQLREQYDLYQSFTGSIPNGLGSAGVHGANPQQMAGYACLFYESTGSLSDGSNTLPNDYSDDVGLLTAWMGQPADRFAAYFGDNIATGLAGGGIAYRSDIMGVNVGGTDVRPLIGNQTAPLVASTGLANGFATQFVAYGGCPTVNDFDEILPNAAAGPAVRGHQFLPGPYPLAASVIFAKRDTILGDEYRRINATFPYAFQLIQDPVRKANGRSARAELVRELLIQFQQGDVLDQQVVDAEPAFGRRLVVGQNHPNPFNPATTIEFTAPARGPVRVRVYNLRGALVTTPLDGEVQAGPNRVRWDGTDSRGKAVGSGAYLYTVEGFGQSETRKMVLIR